MLIVPGRTLLLANHDVTGLQRAPDFKQDTASLRTHAHAARGHDRDGKIHDGHSSLSGRNATLANPSRQSTRFAGAGGKDEDLKGQHERKIRRLRLAPYSLSNAILILGQHRRIANRGPEQARVTIFTQICRIPTTPPVRQRRHCNVI